MSSIRDNYKIELIEVVENKRDATAWYKINPAETQRALKAKSQIAENAQLIDILNRCYAEVIRSNQEDSGYYSLFYVTDLLNNWRPFRLIELTERRALMESIKTIKGNINELYDWEVDLANAFSYKAETRLMLFYHGAEETFIRVIVDAINMSLLREFSKIYTTERSKNKHIKQVDFLIIDNDILKDEILPEDTIILSFGD